MITISPAQLPEYFEGTYTRFRHAALRGLRRGAVRCEGMVKQRTSNLRPYAPVNTGRYKSSWKTRNIHDGAILSNDSPQAGILELGVRPGRIPSPYTSGGRGAQSKGRAVPFSSLVLWAMQKFFRGGKRSQSKTAKAAREQGAFMIAVAVQQKLHSRGMKARRVLTEPRFVAGMHRVVGQEIQRSLSEACRG